MTGQGMQAGPSMRPAEAYLAEAAKSRLSTTPRPRRASGILALFGVLLFAVEAGAFVLLPPEGGFFKPRTPLFIQPPEEIDPALLARLAVELDGVDITAGLAFEAGRFVYRPVEPLAPGPHELRIVEYRPDGSLGVIARLPFEVRKTRLLQRLAAAAEGELAVTRELAADAGGRLDSPFAAQGGLRVAAEAGEGAVLARASAQLFLDSERARGRRLELAGYLLQVNREPLVLNLGHFPPLAESLLSSGFASRGLGIAVGRADGGRLSGRLFVMRSEPVVGFEDPFGIEQPDNRVFGGQLDLRPFADSPERLRIRLTAYRGRGPVAGAGRFGGLDAGEASGLAAEAQARLFGERLTLTGGVARSVWDADGPGGLVGAVSDWGYALRARFEPDSLEVDGEEPVELWFEAGFAAAGPRFASLLGTPLARGRGELALTLGLARGGLESAVAYRQSREDAGAGARIGTSRSDRLGWRGSYRFDAAPFGWLEGIDWELSWTRNRPRRAPPGASIANDRTLAGELGLALARGDIEAEATMAAAYRNDLTAADADEVTRSLGLRLSTALLDGRLVLEPSLDFAWSEQLASGDDARELDLRLGVSLAPLWEGRHELGLELYGSRVWEDAPADDILTYGIEGTLLIELLAPAGARPGLSLALSFSYEEERDRIAGIGDDRYQVYATLRTDWSGEW